MKQQLTPRNLSVLIVLVGVFWTGLEFYEFRTEKLDKLEQERASLDASLTTKKNELRRLRNFAQNIEQVKQELRDLNGQLESALESMPRSFNLAGLLRRISMVAQNSGVELTSFKPKPEPVSAVPVPTPGGAPGTAGAPVAAGTPADGRAPANATANRTFYSTIKIDLTIQGGFTESLVFFDQLTRLKRIVNVDSIRMRPSSGGQKEAGRGGAIPATIEVAVKTYRVSD